MMRIVIYAFPMIVNFILGGMFFISAYRISQAGYSGLVVTCTIAAWAFPYCITSLFMGGCKRSTTAVRLIMVGASAIGLGSIGFLIFEHIVAQFILIAWTGVASAIYCTPFQVFMKAIEPDGNAGVVRSTCLYTFSWSIGMAAGPFVFGILNWKMGFALNAILGFLMAAAVLLIYLTCRNRPAASSKSISVNVNSVDYSKMPDLAWLGWIIAGCGTVAVSLVRTLVPYRSNLLEFGQLNSGLILAVVSCVQAFCVLLMLRGKYWMYRPYPMLAAGLTGLGGLLFFAFGTSVVTFYAGAVCYGVFSGFSYFYLVFHSLVHPLRSSRYVSINEIVVGVASIVGPFAGGIVADLAGADGTFKICALMIFLMAIFATGIFYFKTPKKEH